MWQDSRRGKKTPVDEEETMAKNKYNNFIKSYDTIRDTLRTIFLYGSYSREDFTLKQISGRKYDNERRRILNFLRDDVIDDFSYQGNSKTVRIVYNKYEHLGNFLAESFLTKTFTRNDVILYFLILQVLTVNEHPLDAQEIQSFICELLPEEEDMDISTLRRKLKQMVEEELLQVKWNKNKKLYTLAEDIFQDLSDQELEQLYVAVDFFRNTSPINLPGYYLGETLKKYLHYERNLGVREGEIFTYKHNHLQRIIDDEVISLVFEGIYEQRKVEFQYHEEKKNEKVIPLKLIIEYYYGRQYLYALNDRTQEPELYRIDRVKKIRLGEKFDKRFDNDRIKGEKVNSGKLLECPIDQEPLDRCQSKGLKESLEDKEKDDYAAVLEKSWCATLRPSQGPTEIQVDITLDERTQGFLINRLIKEGRWGGLQRISEGKYVFTIEVNDSSEMIPWLRSFAGYVTVRQSQEHDTRERLLADAKEALKNYGVV